MKTAELAMGLAGTGLQAYLCMVLFVRGFHRRFRFFTFVTALSVATSAALIGAHNHPSLYFDVYWISEVLAVVATFFALREAFYLVFRNFLSISWFKLLFPAIGILMLAAAVLRATFYPAPDFRPLTSAIITLEIAVGFLQFGLFGLFIILVRFFHMRWRQHAFGIVLGFGIAAAGTLVVFLLRSEFGTKLDPVVRITPPIAYIIAVLVWLWTFLKAEPPHPLQGWAPALTPEQMVSEFRRYTKVVKEMLRR
jgi:hypothetical protein